MSANESLPHASAADMAETSPKRKRETAPSVEQSLVIVQKPFESKNKIDSARVSRSRHTIAHSKRPCDRLAPESVLLAHSVALTQQKSSQVLPTVRQTGFPPACATQPAKKTRRPRGYSLSRTAVMFRSHAPTQSMFNRVLEAFGAASAKGMTFVVSVDCTLMSGKVISRRLIDRIGREHVHLYAEADMIASYPVLHEMRERVAEACRKVQWDWNLDSNGRCTRSLAWGCHAECINLWVQKQIREAASVGKSLSWDYLWVLEDDIGKYTEMW